MKDKYYIPTKQELIEYLINGETIYAEVYGTSNLLEVGNQDSFGHFMDFLYASGNRSGDKIVDLDESLYRIKYLDEEDFISLNFKIDTTFKDPFAGKTNRYYKVDEYGFNTGIEYSFHFIQKNKLIFTVYHYGSYSQGDKEIEIVLKNKLELKKFLKQIN